MSSECSALTLLDTVWHWHRTEMNRDEPRWSQDKGMLFDVYIICKRMQLCLTCLQDLHYSTRLRQDEVAICSQFALWLSEVRPWPTVAKHGIGTAYFLVHFSARLKEKEITDKWKTYERMHNFRCAWQRSPWLFAQLFTHLGPSKASERHCIGAARVESLSSAAWPGWPGWQPVFSNSSNFLFWPLRASCRLLILVACFEALFLPFSSCSSHPTPHLRWKPQIWSRCL